MAANTALDVGDAEQRPVADARERLARLADRVDAELGRDATWLKRQYAQVGARTIRGAASVKLRGQAHHTAVGRLGWAVVVRLVGEGATRVGYHHPQ